MVVRWGPEHCAGAELVEAYGELSSCAVVSRLEKASGSNQPGYGTYERRYIKDTCVGT